jgi:hypothetical protein
MLWGGTPLGVVTERFFDTHSKGSDPIFIIITLSPFIALALIIWQIIRTYKRRKKA